MSNKKIGNDFEDEFCQILSDKGFWAHNFAQNQAGQPADVIAVRNGKAYLIDCKVCSDGKFDLSRIEENQDLAMTLWKDCGNADGWFAMLLGEDNIRMVNLSILKEVREREASLDRRDIRLMSFSLDEWLVMA